MPGELKGFYQAQRLRDDLDTFEEAWLELEQDRDNWRGKRGAQPSSGAQPANCNSMNVFTYFSYQIFLSSMSTGFPSQYLQCMACLARTKAVRHSIGARTVCDGHNGGRKAIFNRSRSFGSSRMQETIHLRKDYCNDLQKLLDLSSWSALVTELYLPPEARNRSAINEISSHPSVYTSIYLNSI